MGRLEEVRRSSADAVAAAALAAALSLTGACGGGQGAQPAAQASPGDAGDLSTRAVAAAADTRVLSEAQDAANTVIRAVGDCDAVKDAMPGAQQKLAEAKPRLRTATARDSLERMREQLRKAAEACP